MIKNMLARIEVPFVIDEVYKRVLDEKFGIIEIPQ